MAKNDNTLWRIIGGVIIVLLIGGGVIGGSNLGWFVKNECNSDNQCPSDSKCSLVIMAKEFQFYKHEAQKCVMDSWGCHLCSSSSEKPNYYELCCDNLVK